MRILVTGGAGFIGHHLVEHFLKNTDADLVLLDRLNYASSGLDRLRDIELYPAVGNRVTIFTADLAQPISEGLAKELGQFEYIIHMAAETHVDRSIEDPAPFVMANVVGTMHILNFARTQTNLRRFFYFSTDEIFGPAPEGVEHKEWDHYNSGNPYAASKAGGEELVLAYSNTYRLPCFITHTMNVFGERQHPEKFIPKVIRAVLNGEQVKIHANKEKTKSGSRFWIHARNVAAAILHLLKMNEDPEVKDTLPLCDKFNVVGEREVSNLDMAQFIATAMEAPVGRQLNLDYELVDFHSSRPGHDLRYGLDGSKMKSIGFELPKTFEDTLKKTIEWTIAHPQWLNIP